MTKLPSRRRQRFQERVGNARLSAQWVALFLGVAILLLLGIHFLAVALAPSQGGAEQAKIIHDTRTSILQFLGFLGVAGGLAFTARSYQMSKFSHWNTIFRSTVESISDQESMAVRIGGLYSTQMLLREQPLLQPQIESVLGEFIKERAKAGASTPRDVQVALHVLGSVKEGSRDRNRERVDLSNIYLKNLRLPRLNLERVSFRGAVLEEVDMEHSRLVDVDMTHAALTRVNLSNCNLRSSRFNHALANEEVDMRRTDLQSATFEDALLHGMTGLTHEQRRELAATAKTMPT